MDLNSPSRILGLNEQVLKCSKATIYSQNTHHVLLHQDVGILIHIMQSTLMRDSLPASMSSLRIITKKIEIFELRSTEESDQSKNSDFFKQSACDTNIYKTLEMYFFSLWDIECMIKWLGSFSGISTHRWRELSFEMDAYTFFLT